MSPQPARAAQALQQMGALDQLLEEHRRTYDSEVFRVRQEPRHHGHTEALRADPDRMAKLAELAELDPDRILDVSVRGDHVSFVVVDEDGAPSYGFFPLADLPASESDDDPDEDDDGDDPPVTTSRGGRRRPSVKAAAAAKKAAAEQAAQEKAAAETQEKADNEAAAAAEAAAQAAASEQPPST